MESDAVIALTDVYTGTVREFLSAADAKKKMKQWTNQNPRFFAHAAQHDFEAWLVPYWDDIQKLAGSNRNRPATNPEIINHDKPPSFHLKEIFLTGSRKKRYVKPRDASRILEGNDLLLAAQECNELKDFFNTILMLCNGSIIS